MRWDNKHNASNIKKLEMGRCCFAFEYYLGASHCGDFTIVMLNCQMSKGGIRPLNSVYGRSAIKVNRYERTIEI